MKKAPKVSLHFNELPFGPQPDVLAAAQQACVDANRYPSWDMAELRSALASYCHVPKDWIVVASGSSMIIHQVMIASGQKEVAYCWPSFADYPAMAKGLRMKTQPTAVDEHGSCDLDDLLRHITDETSMVIVCTPNVPTGGIVTHQAMEKFLNQVPSHVTVLIDEAYADFAQGQDVVRAIELVQKYPNVVISRSFSKAQGLAGLRIGYAIAQSELAATIAAAGVTRFHISKPAHDAALSMLKHADEMQERIKAIIRERSRLAQKLRDIGVTVVEGHGNFVWLPVGELAQKITESLAAQGILVTALQPFGVRISVGTSENTDQLIAAWRNADLPT